MSLKKKEIAAYLTTQKISYTEEELSYISKSSQGNAFAVRHTALKMQEGNQIGQELTKEIQNAFEDYLENCVMVQWDSDLLEFLMQMSVTEEFTLPLAIMVTGNCRAEGLLKRAAETGNFLFYEQGIYRLRPVLVRALRKRAAKVYGAKKVMDFVYNAGLYYEMHDQIIPALEMFIQCGRKDRVKELLVRNARRNPGNGYYLELREYYLQLEEHEIAKNAVLMAGMSMLYSLLMQEKESEYWYGKLKSYTEMVKGGQKREALSRLVYLDIALPHRGSANMIEIMKQVPSLLFDKGISLPEFSVTSNCPSTMNGGKDFCHWSKNDRKLAVSIGKLLERVPGKYGRGFVKIALAESLYEKGEDNYEVLAILTRARMEMEGIGMMEMQFVAVGIQVRLDMLHGELQTARAVPCSFEEKVKEQGASKLLPNIDALKCRLALRNGDRELVEKWMDTAPDEEKEFYILERYRYPVYLKSRLAKAPDFCDTALAVLRLQAEGMSINRIAQELSMKSAAVKYHTQENYRKLGASGKTDAVLAARNLGIL